LKRTKRIPFADLKKTGQRRNKTRSDDETLITRDWKDDGVEVGAARRTTDISIYMAIKGVHGLSQLENPIKPTQKTKTKK
jgi:hypothetical protein